MAKTPEPETLMYRSPDGEVQVSILQPSPASKSKPTGLPARVLVIHGIRQGPRDNMTFRPTSRTMISLGEIDPKALRKKTTVIPAQTPGGLLDHLRAHLQGAGLRPIDVNGCIGIGRTRLFAGNRKTG